MSTNSPIIFDESFDCYADALYRYLDNKGIELVWLAEKITEPGRKVKSTQEKFSSWKKDCTKPNAKTRKRIGKILGITIDLDTDGKWVIEEGFHSQDQAKEPTEQYLFEQALNLNRQAKSGEVQPPSQEEELIRGLEVAESLIRLAINNLKKK